MHKTVVICLGRCQTSRPGFLTHSSYTMWATATMWATVGRQDAAGYSDCSSSSVRPPGSVHAPGSPLHTSGESVFGNEGQTVVPPCAYNPPMQNAHRGFHTGTSSAPPVTVPSSFSCVTSPWLLRLPGTLPCRPCVAHACTPPGFCSALPSPLVTHNCSV